VLTTNCDIFTISETIVRCEELAIRKHMIGGSTVQQNVLNGLIQSCYKHMTNFLTTRRLNIINGNIGGATRLSNFGHSGLQSPFLLFVLHIELAGQSFGFNLLFFLFFFPKLLLFEFSPLEVDFAYKANCSNFCFFSDSSTSHSLSIQL